ncbi:hypothetical protein NFI96_029255 [Prochilodus magdalenae]|nr:hypothetical protein NFI96_029255 [Prochilodus magdalenae]
MTNTDCAVSVTKNPTLVSTEMTNESDSVGTMVSTKMSEKVLSAEPQSRATVSGQWHSLCRNLTGTSTNSSFFIASHSLQYFYTAFTHRATVPKYTVVGLLDGEQIVYSDSNTRKMIPKLEWTRKIDMDVEVFLTVSVDNLMQHFNQTKGVRTVQRMFGCELYDDGTHRVYDVFGSDGEDALALDQNTGTWTAASPKAVTTKQKWERTCDAIYRKTHLENACIYWLQKYVEYGGPALERKVSPEVSLFQKNSSSPVVCHATGFYPKAVMISWKKNGEDLYEDVELGDILPNQDGTFQRRSILTVPPEELDKHNYTCVVQHGGLEREMVLQVSGRRVLSGGESVGVIVGVMVGAVVAVLLLILIGCVGGFIWKKKKKSVNETLNTIPPHQHFTVPPHQHFTVPPYQHFTVPPHQHFTVPPHQHFTVPPYQHFTVPPYQHFTVPPHQHFTVPPYQHFTVPPHQHFTVPPYQQFTVPPYQRFTVPPYQCFTSPYQRFTSPYQRFTSPYQRFTSPYQHFTVPPYQCFTSPHQHFTVPPYQHFTVPPYQCFTSPYQHFTVPPYQHLTSPYQCFTSPYQRFTVPPYQHLTSPYQCFTSPYQHFTVPPYQHLTSPYQCFTSPYLRFTVPPYQCFTSPYQRFTVPPYQCFTSPYQRFTVPPYQHLTSPYQCFTVPPYQCFTSLYQRFTVPPY